MIFNFGIKVATYISREVIPVRGAMKSIRVIKKSFKIAFCIFFLFALSGCFDKPIIDEGSNTSPSRPDSTGMSTTSATSTTSTTSTTNSQNGTSNTFSESFSIASSKKLDILVVLPGGSAEEKGKLGLSLSRLLSKADFQSVDWQVAFISEDPSQNNNDDHPTFLPLRDQDGNIEESENNEPIYILTPELQADHIVTELIIETMMSSGGSQVRPLISAIQSVGKSENQTFFRQGALLALIMLSKGQDEEENTLPLGVTASVQNHLSSSKRLTAYGIITEVGDTTCAKAQTKKVTNFSYAVSALINEVEGISGSICEEDYDPLITQIGSDIEDKLEANSNEIQLKHTNIVENTIRLSFTPAENAQSWQFNSQESRITFGTPLSDGTTVQVSYNYLTNDSSNSSNP